MPRKKPLTAEQQKSVVWFKELLKKVAKADSADSYTKGERKIIKPGSMITFSYPNPKTALSVLKFFDAQPLVIIFNIKGRYIYGLNLHWTARPMREILMKMVVKLNKSAIDNNKSFDLNWQMIKEFLVRNGLEDLIVKTYITSRIRGLQYIPYSQWKYASVLPTEEFVLDGQYSIEDIQAMIRGAAKKTKSSKNVRTGRSTK